MKLLKLFLASCALLALWGCTYYVPAGAPVRGYSAPGPSSFDRSFSAAAGAMRDQGLGITVEDRASGTIVGKAGNGTVTANLRTQADGSVRVQFSSSGAVEQGLIERVSSSYDRHMGR